MHHRPPKSLRTRPPSDACCVVTKWWRSARRWTGNARSLSGICGALVDMLATTVSFFTSATCCCSYFHSNDGLLFRFSTSPLSFPFPSFCSLFRHMSCKHRRHCALSAFPAFIAAVKSARSHHGRSDDHVWHIYKVVFSKSHCTIQLQSSKLRCPSDGFILPPVKQTGTGWIQVYEYMIIVLVYPPVLLYTVSQTILCKIFFCQNFVKFPRTFLHIDRTNNKFMWDALIFHNSCQRLTVLNADVPNWYITQQLLV